MVTQIDPHFKDYRQAEKDEKRKTEALKKLKFKNDILEELTEEDKEAMEKRAYDAENHYLAPELIEKQLAVFDSEGKEFTGDCWPGTSIWVDYLNLKAQEYFGDQYLKEDHIQRLPHVQIKNDMNEPSVFNPVYECTMPKNNIHTVSHYKSTDSKEVVVSQYEHRDVHSLYGILMAKSSYEGMIKRTIEVDGKVSPLRAFLLSRSFFIGSQKYGTMWIGDSGCKWDHIKRYIPMCTTVSMSGFSFCGFDTPGFWLDPTPEFCTRGYQIGCLFPFFRAHSDRKAKRREPYLFKSPYKDAMIRAVETRYELVMVFYTAFYKHRLTDHPVMRPVIDYESGSIYRDQVFIGDHLMGKALVEEGMTQATVYLPTYDEGSLWYQRHKGEKLVAGESVEIDCEITEHSEVPIFVKGGSIIPEYFDLRENG